MRMTLRCVTCGREDQLLLEALDDGRVAGILAADDLESDDAIQLDVARLVDGAHAAFAEQREDFIALAENVAGLEHGLATEHRIAHGAAGGGKRGRRLACGRRRTDIGRSVAGRRHFRRRAFPFERRAQTAVRPLREVVLRGKSSSILVDDFRAPTARWHKPLKLMLHGGRRTKSVYNAGQLKDCDSDNRFVAAVVTITRVTITRPDGYYQAR